MRTSVVCKSKGVLKPRGNLDDFQAIECWDESGGKEFSALVSMTELAISGVSPAEDISVQGEEHGEVATSRYITYTKEL